MSGSARAAQARQIPLDEFFVARDSSRMASLALKLNPYPLNCRTVQITLLLMPGVPLSESTSMGTVANQVI